MTDHHGHLASRAAAAPRATTGPGLMSPGFAPASAEAWTDSDLTLVAIAAGMAGGPKAAEASDAPQAAASPGGLRVAPGRPRRRCGAPAPRRAHPVDVLKCHIVWRLVTELFAMVGERDLPAGVAARRPHCQVRQIAIYLSHVVLSVPYRTIAEAFARDRTTVVHACAVVEDRRDDSAYDRFVERCERCIAAVFAPLGADHAER